MKWLSGETHTHHHEDMGDVQISWNENVAEQEEVTTPHCIGCAEDPVAELEEWQRMADIEIEANREQENTIENSANNDDSDKNSDEESGGKISNEDFVDHLEEVIRARATDLEKLRVAQEEQLIAKSST